MNVTHQNHFFLNFIFYKVPVKLSDICHQWPPSGRIDQYRRVSAVSWRSWTGHFNSDSGQPKRHVSHEPAIIDFFFLLPSPPVFELNKSRHALLTTTDDKFVAIQQLSFNDFSNKINTKKNNVYFDLSVRTTLK